MDMQQAGADSVTAPVSSQAEPPAAAAEQIHALLMEFVRAAGVLQADQPLPGHSVSLSQVFALHELDSDGAPAMSQQHLAERLQLEKSTISRMVAEMERKALLVRERDPDNRRQYRLRLTDLGRAVHKHLASGFHARYEAWVAALTPTERCALVNALPALVRVIREHVH